MITAPPAQPRPSLGPARPSAAGALTRLVLLAALLGLVCLRDAAGLDAYRVRQAAAPYAFSLLEWEASQIARRPFELLKALRGDSPAPSPSDESTVRSYFQAPPAVGQKSRREAEVAIQRLVTHAWRAEGLAAPSWLAGGEVALFPPVSFTITEPPQMFIVSPRDRIEVSQYVLLDPATSAFDASLLEERVDSRGLSTLVTSIGGLATYPAMVLASSSAEATLAAVAHEWVHAYFFFQPVGRGYWASQDLRTINETAAELAGTELGRLLAGRLGLPTSPPGGAPSPRQAELNSLLRATRLEVDRLLAAGQVEQAERYMAERRLEINARGFNLRRLNQAYFAFHGSYAEGPAGSSPIAGQVRRLRERASSLGDFLRIVAGVSTPAELAAVAG